MTNAEARIRNFIERIIRLKEEQDALTDDIREIYKEAAGEGFNKTALGNVVTLVRKRAKDGEKLAALEADVALYLAAYEGSGTAIAPARIRPTPPAAPVEGNARPVTPDPQKPAPLTVEANASIPVQSHKLPPIEVADPFALPVYLIRDKATGRAPWMDREAGE